MTLRCGASPFLSQEHYFPNSLARKSCFILIFLYERKATKNWNFILTLDSPKVEDKKPVKRKALTGQILLNCSIKWAHLLTFYETFLCFPSTHQPCDEANFQATFSNTSISRYPGDMLLLIIFRSRSPATHSRGKRSPKIDLELNWLLSCRRPERSRSSRRKHKDSICDERNHKTRYKMWHRFEW